MNNFIFDHDCRDEQGNTLTSISKLLSTTEYSGYPIVKSLESMQALLLHLAPSTLDPKP